jgi:hypothetical protein
MTRFLPPDQPIEVGQTFRLPQTLTGFADVKGADDPKAAEERWAIVVAARPSEISAWVLPRSASVRTEVPVPATAAAGFTSDGWVWFKPRQVVFKTLRAYEYGGPLEASSLASVRAFYEANVARQSEERRARRAARPDRGRRGRGGGARP